MAGSDYATLSLRRAGVSLIDCEHRTPPASDAGYPYLAIPQVKDGRLDLREVRRISRTHYLDWTRKARPQAFDVVLSRRCNPGETAFIPPNLECALGQNLVLLRADGSVIDPQFLRWLVRSPAWWEQVAKNINVGAVFDSLKCADIPNFELPVPPLREQRAIVNILGALDDKIDLNRRTNETLEGIARALFKSWFVDFDPVRAKVNGTSAIGTDAATAAFFPSAFARSDVGQIPEGWQLLRVADLVRLIVERVEANSAKDQLRYIALDDMPARSVALTAHRPGSEVTSSITAFKKNDILFGSMRPYFHKVGLASFDGITRTTTFVLRSIDSAFRSFALMHLSSSDAVEFATTASVGTTIPYVRWDALGSYPVVTPPRPLVERFDATLDPLLERLALTGEENASLTALRDTLLPRLLSGEVRILDAEREVAAAV